MKFSSSTQQHSSGNNDNFVYYFQNLQSLYDNNYDICVWLFCFDFVGVSSNFIFLFLVAQSKQNKKFLEEKLNSVYVFYAFFWRNNTCKHTNTHTHAETHANGSMIIPRNSFIYVIDVDQRYFMLK